MSRLISELLAAKEPMFSMALRQLEQASGRPGVDVRLAAEMIGRVQQKTRALGLDPRDTTGAELYHALLGRVKQDDEHLVEILGGNETDDITTLIPLIKKKAEEIKVPRSCWVLKKSVAKEFLKHNPPINIMSILGYKSIDSMLKNENIFEIFGALRFAESPQWLSEFNSHYDSVKPTDFEERDIEIVVMPTERWADLAKAFIDKKQHNITHLKEIGVIVILPFNDTQIPGISLLDLSLIIHYINKIRSYSSFFKHRQVRSNFSKFVVDALMAQPLNVAVMADQKIHWRVIHHYFGKLEAKYHPEILEPHVQPEDLYWRKTETILGHILPELNWWIGFDYIGVFYQYRPVAFNLIDMAINYSNGIAYKDRVVSHFRESLWNELFERYMGEKVLEQQVLKQLDNTTIAPETIQSSVIGRGL